MTAARRIGPSLFFFRTLSSKRLLAMSTKTIAVLDLADIKDGQMYGLSFIVPHLLTLTCSAGRTFHLIQEQSFCLV